MEYLNTYGMHHIPARGAATIQAAQQGRKATSTYRNARLGQYFATLMEPSSGSKHRATASHTPQSSLNADEAIAAFIAQE
jgi:hypothetical protein